MDFETFIQITHDFWEDYLRRVKNSEISKNYYLIDQNGNRLSKKLILLYPTILLCTKTDEYFVSELLGSQSDFSCLSLKTHKTNSINTYFSLFDIDDVEPSVEIAYNNGTLSGIWCGHDVDREALYSRFPFLAQSDAPRIIVGTGKGAPIAIRNKANFTSLQNCIVVNRYSSAIRVKNLKQVDIIHSTTKARDYIEYLNKYGNANDLYAIQYVNTDEEEIYQVAGQFVNFYLLPGLRETTIGEFLHTHPQFIKTAFGTSRFEYEPYFTWQEGPYDSQDPPINPDLLIQRPDGHFDIYDLKTALLSKKNLTTGKRSRRRFIDYVHQGVAQLAHYAEYFTYVKNQEYALKKYNVSVVEPRLVLVVGNFENINKQQIDEASRMLKNFEIIDYDTILHLYLNASRITDK